MESDMNGVSKGRVDKKKLIPDPKPVISLVLISFQPPSMEPSSFSLSTFSFLSSITYQ